MCLKQLAAKGVKCKQPHQREKRMLEPKEVPERKEPKRMPKRTQFGVKRRTTMKRRGTKKPVFRKTALMP